MKAPNHPEYAEEQQHLEQAVAHIEAELARPFHAAGIDDRADVALALADKRHRVDLQESLQQVYFARVDERSGSAGRHTMYIGKHFIHRLNIYSWADTRAGDLYYKTTRDLLLKRNYEISYNTLDAIRDQYVHASLADVLVAEQFTNSLLHKILQESRGGYLHDIVATIQEQQYHIIQAPRDTLMVVQGVPGSGKSSIALHRMAYLMYNHRATLKNILVLGPSRIFLDYIGNILPSLGEHNVPHRTFAAWLLEKLGKPVSHYPQEHLLERLLDPATPDEEKTARHRNALNKGSLRMASLLDRYVDVMQQDLFKEKQPLLCHVRLRRQQNASGQSIAIEIKAERSIDAILVHLDALRGVPLNRRKPELERRLVSDLASEMLDNAREQFRAHNVSPFTYDEKEVRRSIEEHVTRQVHDYFAWWDALNPTVAYRRLFQSPTLVQAGNGIFPARDLETLALYRPKAQAPFDFADLAPLVYLKILLDGLEDAPRSRSKGRAVALYDHIVADEAQDISPLYFKILDKYSRASSMTVLGDLAQGVYTENAINSWHDLLAATSISHRSARSHPAELSLHPPDHRIRQRYAAAHGCRRAPLRPAGGAHRLEAVYQPLLQPCHLPGGAAQDNQARAAGRPHLHCPDLQDRRGLPDCSRATWPQTSQTTSSWTQPTPHTTASLL